jgi:ADP-heptose:LPS heptosyltransferase
MKILIVQIGHYGDAVLLTPMLRVLHEQFPQARLHVLAARRNHAILRTNPWIERIHIYDKRPLALIGLLAALRRERFDVWIDPKDHFSRESAMLALLGGAAAASIGANRPGSSVFKVSVPSAEENNAAKLHVVARNLNALHGLAVQGFVLAPAPLTQLAQLTQVTHLRPELFCDDDSEAYTHDWLAKRFPEVANLPNQPHQPHRKLLAVLNISAGDASRYWTLEGWKMLARTLEARNYAVAVNAVPSDALLAGSVADGAGIAAGVFPSRSVMDAVSLIKRASVLVSPDTAAIHIAAAFDVPTLGLYNALEWNVHKFAPLSTHARVLQPHAGAEYLRDIEPNRANDVLLELLENLE